MSRTSLAHLSNAMVKRLACVLLAFGPCCLGVATPDYNTQWAEFKTKFGKTYKEDEIPESVRFQIFKRNVKWTEIQNAQSHNFTVGIGPFADLNQKEFAETHGGEIHKPLSGIYGNMSVSTHEYRGEALAGSMDWSTRGAVTAIKAQGKCGSCWAFATTGALEGAYQIATRQLVPLSEQQFVDCSIAPPNNGCQGGNAMIAMEYAKSTAICKEKSYAYKGVHGICEYRTNHFNCQVGLPAGTVKQVMRVAGQNEQALMSAVAKTPVAVSIEADLNTFQHYQSGILTSYCGTKLDHAVLVVGYGTDPRYGKYWKVKNSWGTWWGESGYARLMRGKGSSGECGILTSGRYPVMAGSPTPGPSPPSPPVPPPGPNSAFERFQGYLGQGNSIKTAWTSVSEAETMCMSMPQCMGFTFSGSGQQVGVNFKSVWQFAADGFTSSGWTSYKKVAAPSPVPPAPAPPGPSPNGMCVQPQSLPYPSSSPGHCTNCLESAQCQSPAYCCPYMKKCITKGMSCYSPIASCQPTCFSAHCTSCKNWKDSAGSNWQKPTCAGPSPGPSPRPSPAPSPGPSSNGKCVRPHSLPVPSTSPGHCTNCLESAQCQSGAYCCPYMKKCITSGMSCYTPIATCQPTCSSAHCTSCQNWHDSAGSNWQKPTCTHDTANFTLVV